MRVSVALFCLALLTPVTAQDTTVYMGRALIFRADIEKGRTNGWVAADTPDDEVLDAVAAGLLRRVRSMGRFPEAQVEREDGGRFAVVFVGKMADNMESFLAAGLANAGRLSYRVVATDDDLAESNTGLEDERQRLQRWLADNDGESVLDFDLLPREEGGPHPAIQWLPRQASGTDGVRETAPLAVRRGRAHYFEHADLAESMKLRKTEKQTVLGFGLSLTEISTQALHGFHQANAGREIAFVINDHVASVEPVNQEPRANVLVNAEMSMDDFRALLLGFSGGPLDAPLTFVEFGKRELRNVAGKAPKKDAPPGK